MPKAGHVQQGFALAAWVLLVTSVVRLGSTLYLPALPALGNDLHLSVGTLSTTLTVFFAFFTLATLCAGPVVDGWGRRLVVRWGLLFFALGSAWCALAEGPIALLAGRALQAIGAGVIPVAGRVIVRDAYEDHRMIGVLGWMGLLGSLIPILSPIAGGFLVQHVSWRSTFHLLVLLAALSAWASWRSLPETLVEVRPLQLGSALRDYLHMARSARFVWVMAPMSVCFTIQGVFFATAPHIFVTGFGLSPSAFGLAILVLVAALVCGRSLSALLLGKVSAYALYLASSGLVAAGGVLMLGLQVAGQVSMVSLLGATSLFCLGFGGLMPLGMRALLSGWNERAGLASALFGCFTFGAMALGSGAVSLFALWMGDTLWILALLAAVFGMGAPACAARTRQWL